MGCAQAGSARCSVALVCLYLLCLDLPAHANDLSTCSRDTQEQVQVPALVQASSSSERSLRPSQGFAALEEENANNGCEWTVHYDKWMPIFQPGEYERNDAKGGARCLEACCHDPTCLGLVMESKEKGQCYKYVEVPDELGNQGKPLHNGLWLLEERNAWSIFIKRSRPVRWGSLPSYLPSETTEAHREIEEENLQSGCQWSVHYNKWEPTFDKGEYRHDDSTGGAHCLAACCKDPTCEGLALESFEQSQCYKYSKLGAAMRRMHDRGRLLGDGLWLLDERPAWSVFVKVPKRPDVSNQRPHHQHIMPTSVISTKTRQILEENMNNGCEWTVHYNKWMPTFDQGLAAESLETGQCYKYRNAPAMIGGGRRLGDGLWLLLEKPAWSVFVKASQPKVAMSFTAPTHQLTSANPRYHEILAENLDNGCEWTVHYNRWATGVSKRVYEPMQETGSSCLVACCQDPTCEGLEWESLEDSQCYKYRHLQSLDASEGRPLGDGQWIQEMQPRWSVFVKSKTVDISAGNRLPKLPTKFIAPNAKQARDVTPVATNYLLRSILMVVAGLLIVVGVHRMSVFKSGDIGPAAMMMSLLPGDQSSDVTETTELVRQHQKPSMDRRQQDWRLW